MDQLSILGTSGPSPSLNTHNLGLGHKLAPGGGLWCDLVMLEATVCDLKVFCWESDPPMRCQSTESHGAAGTQAALSGVGWTWLLVHTVDVACFCVSSQDDKDMYVCVCVCPLEDNSCQHLL